MYEDRLVAFLDILGFSEAIKESVSNTEKFQQLYEFLNLYSSNSHSKEVFSKFAKGDGSPCDEKDIDELIKTYEYSFTQFSDSFIFSVKVESKSASQFFPILISQFTNRAFELGLLVRGGISIGKLVHINNGPTFGPAFIDAYKIENRQAVFARTVICKRAFDFLDSAGIYCQNWIDIGYDGVKEITIASYINELYSNNEINRITEIRSAISRLSDLKNKIPEKDREACEPKYNYIQAKLSESLKKRSI